MTILQSYADSTGSVILRELPICEEHGPYAVFLDYPKKANPVTIYLGNSVHYFDDLESAHRRADDEIRRKLNAMVIDIKIQLPELMPEPLRIEHHASERAGG